LIVAVNVANLLLARASRREKEIAIRLALGAGRGRLMRQFLTESLVLSLLGAACGVLLAFWMAGLIQFLLPNSQMPLGFGVGMDSRILGCSLLLALATGVSFGLAPAWQTSRPRLNETLKEGGRAAAAGTPHHRVLNGLVVSQVALAVVLLIGAGLCLKGLRKARQIDLGFDPHHLLYLGVMLALGLTHLLANFLYGVSPFDAITFTLVPLFLAFITLLACWVPARYASKVDPLEALRCE
jgi:ABC-type antimicrobial peptide transport system permease subunit